jgi:hypothetical protein
MPRPLPIAQRQLRQRLKPVAPTIAIAAIAVIGRLLQPVQEQWRAGCQQDRRLARKQLAATILIEKRAPQVPFSVSSVFLYGKVTTTLSEFGFCACS